MTIEGYFPGAPDDGPTVAGLIDEAERRLSECRARCERLEAIAEAAEKAVDSAGPECEPTCLRCRNAKDDLRAALVAAGATGKADEGGEA